MRAVVLILAVVSCVHGQTSEGDSCTQRQTGTVGRCARADRCESARADLLLGGIKPTYCALEHSFDGIPIVCCRDQRGILQATPTRDSPPAWGVSGSDRRRVSERKCSVYTRNVVYRTKIIPLLPEPPATSLSSANCNYTGVDLIVGGQDATLGEFPHMAAIGWANFEGSYTFSCGGSLVSARHVLTAGHCTRDPHARKPIPAIVRLADQNIDPTVADGANPIDVPIKTIHKHPEYKPPKRYNDIAILELNTDVEFTSSVRPACLWTRNDFGSHKKALATGWGVTDTETLETAKELQKVSLSLLENDYCEGLLNDSCNRNWCGFIDGQLCAGELRGGKDTCQGDSGSPLQIASNDNQCIFHIVGITSIGRECAVSGQPAVYTRVSSYLSWIESVVWPGE